MLKPKQLFLNLSFNMHLQSWQPEQNRSDKAPILLIHGLSSNAQTWNAVGQLFAEAGHQVVAMDQRNHGLSEKTDSGFDFETITSDVNQLLDHLGWERPLLIGQSWGGNVLTEFGARYPGRCVGYVMVDGGFLDFGGVGGSWGTVSKKLTPPDIDRFPAETLRYLIQSSHQDWTEEGLDGTMANFELLEDGTIRRRLEISKHIEIVRHLFEQTPSKLYPKIKEPVLICAAGSEAAPDPQKQAWLDQTQKIEHLTLKWFGHTDHDIHIQKPNELVETIFSWHKTKDKKWQKTLRD